MKLQFELWRLLASITCFAVSLGLARFMEFEVRDYGPGFFPSLIGLTALAFLAAGLGVIFRRGVEFAMKTLIVVLRIIVGFFRL